MKITYIYAVPLCFALLAGILFTTSRLAIDHNVKELHLGDSTKHTVKQENAWYIWGADVIKLDSTYYMFYSRWPAETEMAGWLTHSEIALATSESPTGPFTYQRTVLTGDNDASWDGGMVHSPKVFAFESKLYLYYTGVPKLESILPLSEQERNILKDNRRLGIAVADNPEGPWEKQSEPIIDIGFSGEWDSLATANPAILQKPNGEILLVYKGIKQVGDVQEISLLSATSKHPLGPFTAQGQPLFDSQHHVEDPEIWLEDNVYYMIAHDVDGHYSGASDGRSLAFFYSLDGVQWQAADNPLASRRRVNWDDGTTTYFQRFERPHVLIEDGKAKVMYVAVKEAEGLSYSVAIPMELK